MKFESPAMKVYLTTSFRRENFKNLKTVFARISHILFDVFMILSYSALTKSIYHKYLRKLHYNNIYTAPCLCNKCATSAGIAYVICTFNSRYQLVISTLEYFISI